MQRMQQSSRRLLKSLQSPGPQSRWDTDEAAEPNLSTEQALSWGRVNITPGSSTVLFAPVCHLGVVQQSGFVYPLGGACPEAWPSPSQML